MRALVYTRWDEVQVRLASAFFSQAAEALGRLGVEVEDVRGGGVRAFLEAAARCDEVYACAHGAPEALLLEDGEVGLGSARLFSGKLAYFAACSTGRVLGRAIGEAGGEFLGFESDFLFAAESANPDPRSPLLQLFLRPLAEAAVVAHERGVVEAAESLRDSFLSAIPRALALGYPEAVPLLLHDADAVVAYSSKGRFEPLNLALAFAAGGAAALLLLQPRRRQRL